MKREAIKGKDVYVSMSKWVRLFFGFLYKYCEEFFTVFVFDSVEGSESVFGVILLAPAIFSGW